MTPFRSIRRGRQLFQRKFTIDQGAGPRTADGVGDIEADGSLGAGLADSCAACHGRPRGAAGFGGDVFTRPDSRDAPHLFGLGLQEMLGDEITADLRAIRAAAISKAQLNGVAVIKSLDSKGINYGSITGNPDGTAATSDVEGVNPDLRVRPFFAHGATISIREFIVGALNAEMGLETFDPLLAAAAAGATVVTPSGMVLDGSLDVIEAPPVSSAVEDGDAHGLVDEIDPALVDHLEFYLLNYFKPGTYAVNRMRDSGRRNTDRLGSRGTGTSPGLRQMRRLGCTSCHIQKLTVDHDRRVADVETVHDPVNGIGFNPGDPTDPDFPQRAHGSINLGALFNDPSEGE